ncbi:hypothetical protein C8J57DRAFT_1221719 [Mycena rebaudengoi]|nr:hypothetical protein C8J57DRAFT_1221719 [Mycena rebaudengoi]
MSVMLSRAARVEYNTWSRPETILIRPATKPRASAGHGIWTWQPGNPDPRHGGQERGAMAGLWILVELLLIEMYSEGTGGAPGAPHGIRSLCWASCPYFQDSAHKIQACSDSPDTTNKTSSPDRLPPSSSPACTSDSSAGLSSIQATYKSSPCDPSPKRARLDPQEEVPTKNVLKRNIEEERPVDDSDLRPGKKRTKIRIGDLVEAECARTLLAALAQLGAPRGPDPMGFETHACHILLGPANMQQQSKLNASAVHVQTLWLLRFLQTGTASLADYKYSHSEQKQVCPAAGISFALAQTLSGPAIVREALPLGAVWHPVMTTTTTHIVFDKSTPPNNPNIVLTQELQLVQDIQLIHAAAFLQPGSQPLSGCHLEGGDASEEEWVSHRLRIHLAQSPTWDLFELPPDGCSAIKLLNSVARVPAPYVSGRYSHAELRSQLAAALRLYNVTQEEAKEAGFSVRQIAGVWRIIHGTEEQETENEAGIPLATIVPVAHSFSVQFFLSKTLFVDLKIIALHAP